MCHSQLGRIVILVSIQGNVNAFVGVLRFDAEVMPYWNIMLLTPNQTIYYICTQFMSQTGNTDDQLRPCLLTSLKDAGISIVSVHAGSVHTCALSETRQLYTYGKREYTGHAFDSDLLVPTLLEHPFDGAEIVQISVGPGSYHTIALTSTSKVYTWGHNRVGQLGYATRDDFPRNSEGAVFVPSPRLVESLSALEVTKVSAGWGHTAVITAAGHLWVCGRGLHGQLGVGDPRQLPVNEREHPFLNTFTRVDSLVGSYVHDVACGGEHTVALVDTNQLYTFGHGLHGQLGHGSLASVTVPRRVRVPELDGRQVLHFVCGTNVTMVVAGAYAPQVPSLADHCWEVVDERDDWQDDERVVALRAVRT
jgi:alpha-tubulin suppressor-like RCC1 family protein